MKPNICKINGPVQLKLFYKFVTYFFKYNTEILWSLFVLFSMYKMHISERQSVEIMWVSLNS